MYFWQWNNSCCCRFQTIYNLQARVSRSCCHFRIRFQSARLCHVVTTTATTFRNSAAPAQRTAGVWHGTVRRFWERRQARVNRDSTAHTRLARAMRRCWHFLLLCPSGFAFPGVRATATTPPNSVAPARHTAGVRRRREWRSQEPRQDLVNLGSTARNL